MIIVVDSNYEKDAMLFFYMNSYTCTQCGNYHHGKSRNPTAALNLFAIGKQYLI